MTEKIVLKWADGTVFEWDTGNILHARRVINLQRHHGDPVEIIGEGSTADLLRRKYEDYRAALAANRDYDADVMGTASQLKGIAKEKIEEDFEKATQKLKKIRNPIGRLWREIHPSKE